MAPFIARRSLPPMPLLIRDMPPIMLPPIMPLIGGRGRDLLLFLGDKAGDVDLLPQARLQKRQGIIQVVGSDRIGGQLFVLLGKVIEDLEVLLGIDFLPPRP